MRRLVVVYLIFNLIQACSWPLARGPADKDELFAGRMISEISAANTALRPFKGLGNIRIISGKTRLSARVAWIADPQARRLRIEIMGPGGRPVARLVANGSSVFFFYYDHGRLQSYKLSSGNLKPLIDIPIEIDDFIFFLAGSIPVKAHDFFFVGPAGNMDRQVAVLTKRWSGIVEKIGFIPGKSRVADVEIYGWFGSKYRVDMVASPGAETGRFLSAMIFSRGDNRVRIETERQWKNASVPADAFDTKPTAP